MTPKTSNSSNIFLFFGDDDFSLRRKVDFWKSEFAKKHSAAAISVFEASSFSEDELIKKLRDELAPSLFSSKKLIILKNVLPRKAETGIGEFLLEFIPQIPKDFFVVFWESAKPDGRLGFTKKFLKLVTINEFMLPHGTALNQWIKSMAKNLNVSISEQAADKLAQFLGRDLFEEKKVAGRVVERKEAFNLWQVYSELQKLATKTGEIESEDVAELVKPKIPDSVFALTDEMLARNQKGAYMALENFLSGQNLDEKSSLIKIIALIAEQIRSLLLVSLLLRQGLNNDQIAEKLGWSSGRVFVTAKNAYNLSNSKLQKFLAQLLFIDSTLKSSENNAKLLVDLFITQVTF